MQQDEPEELFLEDEEVAALKKLRSLTQMRLFHERQVHLIERLPAGEVAGFLENQRSTAAAAIQKWWRKKGARNLSGINKPNATTLRQKTFPLRREEGARDSVSRGNPGRQSEDEMRQTHNRVQKLLKEFHSRQSKNDSASEEKLDYLIQQLEENCCLLETAPRLSELEREDQIDERFLVPQSQTIAAMAQNMHEKELQAAGLSRIL